MELHDLVQAAPSWLSGTDDAGGIVISCRARLARNLADYPFAATISEVQQRELIETVLEAAKKSRRLATANYFNMGALDSNDRRVLVERHLISPALADGTGERAVLFNADESLSVMINEEDHLRLQALAPGQGGAEAWASVNAVDDEISAALQVAYSDERGFLTACPTNTGTGLRVSGLMHLPALVLTEDMERVIQGLTQLSFTVRGVYGEGTNAAGNLFQVSNQSTLGESEIYIIEKLEKIIRQIVEHERNARQVLLERKPKYLYDHIGRAYGILRHAYILESSEALRQLSALRLGIDLSMFSSIDAHTINELLVMIQPGHLQKIHNRTLDEKERNIARADIVRGRLNGSKRETTDEQSH